MISVEEFLKDINDIYENHNNNLDYITKEDIEVEKEIIDYILSHKELYKGVIYGKAFTTLENKLKELNGGK